MRNIARFVIVFITSVLAAVAARAQVNTDQVIRIGQNALYFEDYVLSIQYFNQAIQAKPYLAQPYLLRAIAKLNLDDFAGAEADATTALDINPFLTDAWEVRGVARQNIGNNRGAIADYDRALDLLPRNRQMMFNKALAQMDEKENAAADSTFTDLLRYYPGFDNGYLGRAKLRLALGDTISAKEDIDRALGINRNALNGYILRADIAINTNKDYPAALEDMNQAVKLEPRLAGLYINRAFLRYSLNDFFGAMADYDYALQLEPSNVTALFNRSLLLMEVSDNDRALVDLNKILSLEPDDPRALYNRAVVNGQKHLFDSAIADINGVIDRFPDFSGAYMMRSDFYRSKGDMARAKADYDRSLALSRSFRKDVAEQSGTMAAAPGANAGQTDSVPAELVAKRFNSLLTIDNETTFNEEYNNSAIRGKIQNRDLTIEIEPYIELSFYSAPTELRASTYYIKEVDDINATRILRFLILVTPRPPQISDADLFQRHFSSIEYYNSYLTSHRPRSIDYIGRAMDFITVRNYPSAIADLDRAIALTPDNAVAYLLRAQARYNQGKTDAAPSASAPLQLPRVGALADVLADIDKAIELAPRTAVAWFNKGNILFEMGDFTSAIAAYTRAIELQPDMGEAFYNRGYVYLKLGNQTPGVADLSKAGELGIVAAYNLIKRISR